VNVVDENGCRATSNIVVKVICENKNYFLPNTFSPNNDGQNDVFYPRGRSLDRIQSMRIFNRWGELVFERKNFPPNSQADGWNGLIAGKPAASDAYVYIIEVVCENGQVIPIKGNVTLIR
jgi:gliding motility-associated-like protein